MQKSLLFILVACAVAGVLGNSCGMTCGANKFCVGLENNGRVYCYGQGSGCKWNSNDCNTDADCVAKYTDKSPKYSDGDVVSCPNAGGWRSDACAKRCKSCGLTCGVNKFCVGLENDGRVYCYGQNDGCKWNQNDCSSDADCSKYSLASPKYTDNDVVTCPNAGGWRSDACIKRCKASCGLTCGADKFCVGYENDGRVYCYGETNGCKWNQNDCNTDADCAKYSLASPKYTDGDFPTCPANGWRNSACNKQCTGYSCGMTCGADKFCVGFENNGRVYCYGQTNGCKWNQNDCNTDSDCAKYSTNSPKYTDGDRPSCPNAGGWRGAACKHQCTAPSFLDVDTTVSPATIAKLNKKSQHFKVLKAKLDTDI